MMTEWSDDVSAIAFRNKKLKRSKKRLILPLAEDVQTFHKFLNETEKKYRDLLENDIASSQAYYYLSKIIMTKLTLFNRKKKTCEIELIKLEEYNEKNNDTHSEVLDSLNADERYLVDSQRVINTTGKGPKPVNVVLRASHIYSLDLLIKARNKVEVSKKNGYLLARRTVKKEDYFNGTAALQALTHTASKAKVCRQLVTFLKDACGDNEQNSEPDNRGIFSIDGSNGPQIQHPP